MSGRKVVILWVCVAVALSGVALPAIGDTVSAGAHEAEFEVTDADIEEDTVVAGEEVEITATVENVGNRPGTFTATLETGADGVLETTDVEIDGGETETVEFTRPFEEGTYEISVSGEFAGELVVTAPESPEFEVEDAELSSDAIATGESVDVTAEIENDGDADGTFTAELQVDGETVATERVDVDAEESATVRFTQGFDEAGTYDVAVSGESAGALAVTEPATPDISVTEATLSGTDIDEGESVDVTAAIENAGDAAGEFTAELQVDGETVATERVDVDAGGSEIVVFTRTFDDAGTYEIAVSGESAGELDVTEPATAAISVTEATLSETEIEEEESTTVTATVENTGRADGAFTAELEVDGEVADAERVDVAAGGTETVSFTRTFDEAGTYEVAVSGESAGALTVTEPATPDIGVTEATLSDGEVDEGESVTIAARIENVGDAAGEFTAELQVDGDVVDTEPVDVDAEGSELVEFARTFDETGTYDIAVSGESAGALTVTEPATPEISVTEATLSDGEVDEGESVTITARIENVGRKGGPFTAELEVDDDVVGTESVGVGPGKTKAVEFTRTFDEAGTYDVAVSGESAGALVVTEPAAPDISVTEATLSETEIERGGSVDVTAAIENTGEAEGTFTAELRVDGDVVATERVDIDAGDTAAVEFTRTFDETGTYAIAIGNASAGTLTVIEPADVSIRRTDLSAEEVVAGESVTVTVELGNDGEATGQRTVAVAFGDGTDARRTADVPENGTTLRIGHAYEDTGEYTVSVDGTTVETVRVIEEQGSSGSSGGTGSSGSSGSSGPSGSSGSSESSDSPSSSGSSGPSDSSGTSGSSGSTGSTATGDGGPTVVRSESEEAVTVSVDGVNGERYDIGVELAGPSDARELSLSTLAIEPAGDQDAFEATIGRPTADRGNRTPVPHGTVLGYVDIDSTLDPADTRTATLAFDLRREALPDGTGSDDVAVMRYANGEWTTIDVTHEVDGDDHRATLPHASPVAVVALEPGSVDVVDTVLPADRVRTGYETTLRATVRNPGDRPANRTLSVAMDGASVTEREVSLAPNETTTVRIEFEPTGSGTVSLDGAEVGSITTFGEETDQMSTDTQTEESAPGFGWTVAVLALLVATLAARAARR